MTLEVVEVFADVVCPFAHVGLHRFVARRDGTGRALPRLRVRAWPLELVNGRPFDPTAVAHHVEELRRQVAPERFAKFSAAAVPRTSIPAFAVVAEAYTQGVEIGEAMSLAVRDALFDEGRDIADPDVLAEIAASHGVGAPNERSRSSYERDYAEGRRRGVLGSPHFFAGGRDWFCPSLRIQRDDGQVTIDPDTSRLDALLDTCFAPRE